MKSGYPLLWPESIPRTKRRRAGPGHLFERATDSLFGELGALEAVLGHEITPIVLSCNARGQWGDGDTPKDGTWIPIAEPKKVEDPGVVLYFAVRAPSLNGELRVWRCALWCDQFVTIADNIRALRDVVHGLRVLGGTCGADRLVSALLIGYRVAGMSDPIDEEPPQPRVSRTAPRAPWRKVLGVDASATLSAVKRAYWRAARKAHPDHGGDNEKMQAINAAMAEAEAELAGRKTRRRA